MANEYHIKGVSGGSFRQFLDYHQGRRDAPRYRDRLNNLAPKDAETVYYSIPWIQKKASCYSQYCFRQLKQAISKTDEIASEAGTRYISLLSHLRDLETQYRLPAQQRRHGFITALETECRDILSRAEAQRRELETIDANLLNHMSGGGAELSVHVSRYLEGIKARNPPLFTPRPVQSDEYVDLMNTAVGDIDRIIDLLNRLFEPNPSAGENASATGSVHAQDNTDDTQRNTAGEQGDTESDQYANVEKIFI